MVEKKSYPASNTFSKEKADISPINDLQKAFFLTELPETKSEIG